MAVRNIYSLTSWAIPGEGVTEPPGGYVLEQDGTYILLEDDSYLVTEDVNIWTNGAADNDADTNGNWSLGHKPTSSETALFGAGDGTTDDCTASAAMAARHILFDPSYTGTFDPNGQTITVGGHFVVNAPDVFGTDADHWNGATLDISGALCALGDAGTDLNFRGSAEWTLNVDGDSHVRWADVHNSTASGGDSNVKVFQSQDLGSNPGWLFRTGVYMRYDRRQQLRPAYVLY